jgi:hypothetical protein
MFLDQGPIESTGYMIAGYAVIFGAMLIYLISLFVRTMNLKRDIEVLEDIESTEKRSATSDQKPAS